MNLKRPQSVFRGILIAVFCAVILIPAVIMMTGKEDVYSLTEKRTLAKFPHYPQKIDQTLRFIAEVDTYLNDHFGLRDFLIHRYHREVRKWFGIIDAEIDILKGLDNFYFFSGFGMLEDFLGRTNLSTEALQVWLDQYREKRDWLQTRGIEYLLVIAPEKYSIYPEFVAESWREIRGESRFMQLKNMLQGPDTSSFLDLTPVLLKNKHQGMLYYKSDTHWTTYGAYLGYLAMAETIENMLPGITFKRDFQFSREVKRSCIQSEKKCGDLTMMLPDFEPFQESFKVVKEYKKCARTGPLGVELKNIDKGPDRPSFTTVCKQKTLTAVVFRDSFFRSIEGFFSENFEHVIYLWQRYDQQNMDMILEVFEPDIVIEERVERRLF